MKRFKKTITLFAAALFCIVPFFTTPLTAKAEGPVTYYLKYEESAGDWRYETGTWTDGGSHRELYYMQQAIKDGDLLVVDGNHSLNLTVNVHLSNLTVVNGPDIVIAANGIDNAFVINDSICSINGDVTNADVYANSVANFNNNVGTLRILEEREDLLHATIAVVGTVDHLYAGGKNYKHYEFYNFEANSLRIDKGSLKTDASKYSTTPTAATPAPTTPSAPAGGTTGNAGTSGEYDDVPKTADVRFNPLWLAGIAAVCMIGAYKLKEEN